MPINQAAAVAAAAAEAAEAAASMAATKADRGSSTLPNLLSSLSAATSAEKNALFARDSAGVRKRMRHTLEDNLADPVVVASATALAVRFLQRRYRYPALSSPHSTGGSCIVQQQQHSHGSRRRRQRSRGGESLELLSTTCLHLASKYHCVDAMDLDTVGSPLQSSRVFQLGE